MGSSIAILGNYLSATLVAYSTFEPSTTSIFGRLSSSVPEYPEYSFNFVIMTSRGPKKDDFDPQVPHERKEPRPDFSVQPPSKPLPRDLQTTLDDENLWDSLYDGT